MTRITKKIKKILQAVEEFHIRSRYHFATMKINPLWNVEQERELFSKPDGIWYCWGNCWANFLCNTRDNNGIRWGRDWIKKYNYIYKLIINYKNIIKLKSNIDFKNFTIKYGRSVDSIDDWRGYSIDWHKVARCYDGIDIRYNDKMDQDLKWYLGWDVSSGCIWRIRAIKKTQLVWKA